MFIVFMVQINHRVPAALGGGHELLAVSAFIHDWYLSKVKSKEMTCLGNPKHVIVIKQVRVRRTGSDLPTWPDQPLQQPLQFHGTSEGSCG